MFGFFKSQPPENKLLLGELQRIRKSYSGPNIFDAIVGDRATKEVIALVKKDFSFAENTIGQGGWSVPDAAYLILSEFAVSMLQSGQFHTYRGLLNDQGKAYLRLYKTCVGSLIESRRYSEEEGVDAVIELEKLIAESG